MTPKTRLLIKVRKRFFLLLEVIIAFFLVIMCIIPLIAPHTFILTEQKKFGNQIELDHVVNLIFADIVERLYNNEISWSEMAEKRRLEVDEALMKRVQFEKRLTYKGTYYFEEVKHKPIDESAMRKLYLFNVNLKFEPIGEVKKDKNDEVIGTFNYNYKLFIVRDI